jgi:hypothetical protein
VCGGVAVTVAVGFPSRLNRGRRKDRVVTGSGSREMESLASAVVERVKDRLADIHHGQVRVETCIHYGAVDSSPGHLVVWVLLAGAPDDELPEWFTPGLPADYDFRERQQLDPGLVDWLERLRQAVRDEFSAAQWPEAGEVTVMFDSEHRVREGGGFWYFK